MSAIGLGLRVPAWADAGLPWSHIAAATGLSVDQVADLVLAHRLTRLRRRAGADGRLPPETPLGCLVEGCPRPVAARRLCGTHLEHLGGDNVRRCRGCGATWCALTTQSRRRTTCGDRRCRTGQRPPRRPAPPPDPARQARNAAIVARRRAGESLRDIAADVGLQVAAVSNIAARAGVYRYTQPRGAAQRAARRRRGHTAS